MFYCRLSTYTLLLSFRCCVLAHICCCCRCCCCCCCCFVMFKIRNSVNWRVSICLIVQRSCRNFRNVYEMQSFFDLWWFFDSVIENIFYVDQDLNVGLCFEIRVAKNDVTLLNERGEKSETLFNLTSSSASITCNQTHDHCPWLGLDHLIILMSPLDKGVFNCFFVCPFGYIYIFFLFHEWTRIGYMLWHHFHLVLDETTRFKPTTFWSWI